MKKTILFLAISIVTFGVSAQMLNKELSPAQKEFRKTHQSRVPTMKEGLKTAPSPKMTAANSTASSLPVDRWFPGEWEEVQAITVTWPCFSVPGNWQELGDQLYYYAATPVFSGYGDIYKYPSRPHQQQSR